MVGCGAVMQPCLSLAGLGPHGLCLVSRLLAVRYYNTLVDPTLKREKRHATALRIWQATSCPLGAARSDGHQ